MTTVCPGLMRTGSHGQAAFKGRHEEEFRWFALGNALPGLSRGAEAAARDILRVVARGDAEVVVTLPAKVPVLARAVAPGLVSALAAAADRFIPPEPGGVGPRSSTGADSRGRTPDVLTAHTDHAAVWNHSTIGDVPTSGPLLPAARRMHPRRPMRFGAAEGWLWRRFNSRTGAACSCPMGRCSSRSCAAPSSTSSFSCFSD
ncbi:MAG: hypothetical protein U0804_14530 [Gemmataceae bacterium]